MFNQFNKIIFLNGIANHIAVYGVQCGYKTLMDEVDLNCGAVPEGEYNQVIDTEAPEQFLSLYTQIAENRFAFVVTALIKKDEAFKKILLEFLSRTGRELGVEGAVNVRTAYEVIQQIILDGMPGDETKKIILETEDRIEWEKLIDTHEDAWKKAGGEISVYYELQECFVRGLLEESGFNYEIKDGNIFSISKK